MMYIFLHFHARGLNDSGIRASVDLKILQNTVSEYHLSQSLF